jgi:hypothetical protein
MPGAPTKWHTWQQVGHFRFQKAHLLFKTHIMGYMKNKAYFVPVRL